MNPMDWNVEQICLDEKLSLTNVKNKLFPSKKQDDVLVISKDNYTPKTLVGNWVERRAVSIPQSSDCRTVYEIDFVPLSYQSWKPNQATKWNNKLVCEGLPREILFNEKEEYNNNMTSIYDLCYGVLAKKKPVLRTYNAKQRKWNPEQDLTKCFGSLSQFGLKEALKEEIYRLSEEGIAKCRWSTTYREEISQLQPMYIEQTKKYNRRKADFSTPDLSHFQRKSSKANECLIPLNLQN